MQIFSSIFFFLILGSSLLGGNLCAEAKMPSDQVDSLKIAVLDGKLNEYIKALEGESIEVQEKECDFIISSCRDSLLRSHVAKRLYTHYMQSPVMGEEAVAVHLVDSWFSPGLVSIGNDVEMMNSRIFAEFNRQSLLGKTAPSVTVKDSLGTPCELFGSEKGGFPLTSREYRVVFFYDTQCAKCKLVSAGLMKVLEDSPLSVEVYAVYTGSDRKAWLKYVKEKLTTSETVRMRHFWDPDCESDFSRKWAVLGTPQLFLVNPMGKIVGRKLEPESLYTILQAIDAASRLTYGSDASMDFFESLFGESPSAGNIDSVAAYASSRALSSQDTLSYRQFMGDMLYYMVSQRAPGVKKALSPFIDKYVLSCPEIWSDADDSLKIVALSQLQKDLLGKTPIGSLIPRKLRSRAKTNYIVFYSDGCSACEQTLSVAKEVARKKNTAVRLVNVDQILAEDPKEAQYLFETFDLSILPFILETSRKGVVRDKYISLTDLL